MPRFWFDRCPLAIVAQLVRALDCGSRCRGFEPRRSPHSSVATRMSFFDAILIGLLQGITEFFPVSSSAHMTLAKMLLGIERGERQIIFDLACHLGTLMAALYFLRRDIRDIFVADRKKLGILFIALLPLIPCYFLLKPVRALAGQTQFLGLTLGITSLILFLGGKLRVRSRGQVRDALWIGTMQSAALIPGISRSASTISAAHALGWNPRDAVRFSFLLSIPTILGGNCLELLKLVVDQNVSYSFSSCFAGFLSSGIVGLIAIRYAMRWLEKGNLRPFAWYCLMLAITTTLYVNVFHG